MRILHYSLGFPPYRTGGLTKFCIDLMIQQNEDGHNVALLWPGKLKLFCNKNKIIERKPYLQIESFEIINPLPIPYDEGIKSTQLFTSIGDKNVYLNFLKYFKPEVIHIHTFMGLHKELIESAKELKIKIVFSVHDFFSICPKVTLFKNGNVCTHYKTCESCPQCNETALSYKKMIILQSSIYKKFKDNYFVKKIRKSHRDSYLNDNYSVKQTDVGSNDSYLKLREYYKGIINLIDTIHCNSNLTANIFCEIYEKSNVKIIPISHRNIQDNRKIRIYDKELLNITYLKVLYHIFLSFD